MFWIDEHRLQYDQGLIITLPGRHGQLFVYRKNIGFVQFTLQKDTLPCSF